MAKLDNQNRLLIPKNLLNLAATDFNEDLRIYLNGNEFYLDNPSMANYRKPCLGNVTIDSKNRIRISKSVQAALNITEKSNILCFICEDRITFRKVTVIPEIR